MEKLIGLNLFLILFSFCAKDNQNIATNTLVETDIQFQKIENWDNNLKSFSSGTLGDPDYYQGAINTVSNEKFIEFFVKFFQENTNNINSVPSALAFFVNQPIDELQSLSFDNVIAISSYTTLGNSLHHNLYTKGVNSFEKVTDFSFEVKSLTTNQIQYSLLRKIKTNLNSTYSYLLVLNKFNKSLSGEIDGFKVKKAVQDIEYGQMYHNASQREVPWIGVEEARCPSPCPPGEKGDCEVYENGLSQCVKPPGVCLINGIEETIQDIPSESVDDGIFDRSLLYVFRDSFLSESDIGNKYISYYYTLGPFLYEKISIETIVSTASLATHANDMVAKLLSPEIYGEEVLINDELKSNIVTLISRYINISTNEDYTFILNDMEDDINYFHNKTVNQIIVEVN